MFAHFVVLLAAGLLAYVGGHRRLAVGPRRVAWAAVALVLISFAGLRATSVGADTAAYIARFQKLTHSDSIWSAFESGEVGTNAIYAIAALLGEDPRVFLVLASTIAVLLYLASLRRTSVLPAVSLFVFISFGYYLFHFNGLRQGLALGFFMMAMHHLLARNSRRYIFWCVLAGLFHTTAFLVLPVYLVVHRGLTAVNVAAVIFGSALLALLLGPIVELAGEINPRYAGYAQRSETGGLLLTAFNFLVCAVLIAMRPGVLVELKTSYDRLLILMLAGTSIFAAVTLTDSYIELTRMALYLTVSLVFIAPILVVSGKTPDQRRLTTVAILYLGLGYYFVFLQQIGGYVPYRLWNAV